MKLYQIDRISQTIIFLILIFALYSYGAGLFIDVTRDAGKYATVAKEIYQNGNFINLTIHGDAYDQKPPLLFWLGALGYTVGGISNFWFKFPVFLLILLGIYWAFQLGKSLYNKDVGIVTAILLFFSMIYSLYSMDIHTDTPLQAFVTLSIWQLYDFLKTRKTKHAILGFLGVGLAMLSKGPIGAVIPAFAIGGHILLSRQFTVLQDIRWYLGIILSLIVVSPALIGLMNQFGWEGIKFFFWENMVGRITGSYVKAINDPVFYFHNLLYQLLPWSIIFYMSVFLEFKSLYANKFKASEYVTFTGIWIYFIVLNSASSQLPNYVFAIVPLMTILTAKWIVISIEKQQKTFKTFYITQNFIVGLLWIFVAVISLYLFPKPGIYFWIVLLLFIGMTIYIFKKSRNDYVKILAPSLIAFTCLIFLLNTHVLKFIFSHQAPPKAANYFNENANPDDTLYNYGYGQYELYFYSEPQAIRIEKSEELKYKAGKPGNWIFTDEKGFKDIRALNLRADTIISYDHLYLHRAGRFINPKNREAVLKPMYLIKY